VAGCCHVLVWGQCDIAGEVRGITHGQMADVVYDGVGRATFEASVDSLRTRGTMVSFGASSGVPDPVALGLLNKKSLFLTRPGLAAHITDIDEYRQRSRDVFKANRERHRVVPFYDAREVRLCRVLTDRGTWTRKMRYR
jgi:NADPH2:quinone reductase